MSGAGRRAKDAGCVGSDPHEDSDGTESRSRSLLRQHPQAQSALSAG